MPEKFTVYFSHSWDPEHVDLNLFVWTQIHEHCQLLVDLPDESTAQPPYYINRIEQLLCRSDLFVAVLPHRPPKAAAAAGAPPEEMPTHCPAGALFEIRLAERAGLPRLVLFDARTRFTPPANPPKNAVYVRCDFDYLKKLLPDGEGWLRERIHDWLAWAGKQLRPKANDRPPDSYVLLPSTLPDRAEVFTRIASVLTGAGLNAPIDLDGAFHTDAELFQILSCGGLLVADVSQGDQFPAYCIAHALFVPAVRLWPPQTEFRVTELPSLLRGHQGGYQHDLVRWRDPQQLEAAIRAHVEAMFAATMPVAGYEEGRRLFEKRRYGKHRLFVSHNFPLGDRQLVTEIVRGLRAVAVNCWEYGETNRAAEEWRERMNEELKGATHFAVLFNPGYEQSPACVDEIEWALAHAVPVIPFLVQGREKPHVKFNHLHHQPLTGALADNAAAAVARVREVLLAK